MGRRSKEEIEKEEMSFFLNKKGEIQYHKYCIDCGYGKVHNCQQSFRCLQVICPKHSK